MSDTVNQLQLLQQNLESLSQQKNLIQDQLFELESAIDGLGSSEKSFKIVGKLLIAKDAVVLKKELNEERSHFEMQITEIEEQEKGIKDKMQKLQKELLNSNNDSE